jgi:hypothetical protein
MSRLPDLLDVFDYPMWIIGSCCGLACGTFELLLSLYLICTLVGCDLICMFDWFIVD